MIHIDDYDKKCSTFFFILSAKSRGSCRTFVIVEETKRCTNQLLLLRLLYDEKRDKKETEYGSEILRVNDFFYLFFKFSYLPVNNCYHVLGSLQRDSMPKLHIYSTSSGHHLQFLRRAMENNTSSTRVVLSH